MDKFTKKERVKEMEKKKPTIGELEKILTGETPCPQIEILPSGEVVEKKCSKITQAKREVLEGLGNDLKKRSLDFSHNPTTYDEGVQAGIGLAVLRITRQLKEVEK